TLRLSPVAIVIVPPAVFVKLGEVPDWLIERFPLTRSIVPLFVCAALARARVSERFSVNVPWWLSSRARVRSTRVPTADWMVVPEAIVSVVVPPQVLLARLKPAVAVLKLCVDVTAVDESESVPPLIEPPSQLNAPEEILTLSPAPPEISPVFVKLGNDPD